MSGISSPFNTSTPPPPPPKPGANSNAISTPLTGSFKPPPPLPAEGAFNYGQPASNYGNTQSQSWTAGINNNVSPNDGWLPDIIKDKQTADLHMILSKPEIQQALINSPTTSHASVPTSAKNLQALLDSNIALATNLLELEQRIGTARQHTQSRLLALKALERQWHAKQAEQDEALRGFSASALYQKLNAAVGEQFMLCRAMEESFLDNHGTASEREVSEYIRRLKESRKIAYLRREQKERWDEGRIGGWRG